MNSLFYLSAADTLATVDTTLLDSSDLVHSVLISDTVKIIDTAYFLNQPSFWLSAASVSIALVTLLIAVLSITIPWLSKRASKRKKTARLGVYVMHLLKELTNSIELRIPKITTLVSYINDIQSGSIGYDTPLLHPANALSDIDHQDLYDIFIHFKDSSNEKDFRRYKSILDIIEYFVKHDNFGRINFDKFMDNLKRYENDFKENLNKILRLFDNSVAENQRKNKTRSADNFLRIADEIINSWRLDETPFDFLICRDKLLIPLKIHAVENINDLRATQFLDSIINCNSALDNIINIRKVYGELFDSVASVMKEKKEALDTAINYFSYLAK